jgi:hypothetical protein
MAKLIKLEEAAQFLGISPEKLTEMRSRNEVFGYRDGSTWKFKMEELERIKREMTDELGDAEELEGSDGLDDLEELVDSQELILDDDAEVLEPESGGDAESDSILVSEEELGKSEETTASTIIGDDELLGKHESDLHLAEEPAEGSELRLVSDSKSEGSDAEVPAGPPDSDALGMSDILADELEKPTSASDTARLQPLSGSGDELSLESGSGSIDLSLENEEEPDETAEPQIRGGSEASSSGFGSAIDLELDDDDLVLGSGSGSDVTSGAGDSGINLNHPSDSGLSLEEPLDLTTGSAVESLELGADDLAELDKVAAVEGQGDQADDDFLLTPVDSGLDDEGESGSQVIDLDSEEFDDSADGLEPAGLATGLEEEEETVEFTEVADEAPPAGLAVAGAGAPGIAVSDGAEAPYTIWNVMSLFFVVLLLAFTGILMLDLMNNIWSWQGNYEFNSQIMDSILGWLSGT